MYQTRTLYAQTFLDMEDLVETDIDYLVELEYYRTNYAREDSTIYGIEVVKRAHQTAKPEVEAKQGYVFMKNKEEVDKILKTLVVGKVTPQGLKENLKNIIDMTKK